MYATDFKVGLGKTKFNGLDLEVTTPMLGKDLEYLVKLIDKGLRAEDGLKTLDYLGEGSYGTVYGYKDYAIKFIRREDMGYDAYGCGESNDADVLKALQHIDCIPKIYAVVDSKALIMQRVRGLTVKQFKNKMKEYGYPNFINPRFNHAFKEALKDIVLAGYQPCDLHAKNVMIDEATGMPMIVDVGLFLKMSKEKKEKTAPNRESIDLRKDYYTSVALDWICNSVEEYIEQKSGKVLEHPAKEYPTITIHRAIEDNKEAIRQAHDMKLIHIEGGVGLNLGALKQVRMPKIRMSLPDIDNINLQPILQPMVNIERQYEPDALELLRGNPYINRHLHDEVVIIRPAKNMFKISSRHWVQG